MERSCGWHQSQRLRRLSPQLPRHPFRAAPHRDIFALSIRLFPLPLHCRVFFLSARGAALAARPAAHESTVSAVHATRTARRPRRHPLRGTRVAHRAAVQRRPLAARPRPRERSRLRVLLGAPATARRPHRQPLPLRGGGTQPAAVRRAQLAAALLPARRAHCWGTLPVLSCGGEFGRCWTASAGVCERRRHSAARGTTEARESVTRVHNFSRRLPFLFSDRCSIGHNWSKSRSHQWISKHSSSGDRLRRGRRRATFCWGWAHHSTRDWIDQQLSWLPAGFGGSAARLPAALHVARSGARGPHAERLRDARLRRQCARQRAAPLATGTALMWGLWCSCGNRMRATARRVGGGARGAGCRSRTQRSRCSPAATPQYSRDLRAPLLPDLFRWVLNTN